MRSVLACGGVVHVLPAAALLTLLTLRLPVTRFSAASSFSSPSMPASSRISCCAFSTSFIHVYRSFAPASLAHSSYRCCFAQSSSCFALLPGTWKDRAAARDDIGGGAVRAQGMRLTASVVVSRCVASRDGVEAGLTGWSSGGSSRHVAAAVVRVLPRRCNHSLTTVEQKHPREGDEKGLKVYKYILFLCPFSLHSVFERRVSGTIRYESRARHGAAHTHSLARHAHRTRRRSSWS